MSGNIEEAAKREVERMKCVLENVRLINPEDERAVELLNLARAYQSDSGHFFDAGKMVEAFEAAIISWAYIDAGLHLDAFRMTDEELERTFFTTK